MESSSQGLSLSSPVVFPQYLPLQLEIGNLNKNKLSDRIILWLRKPHLIYKVIDM